MSEAVENVLIEDMSIDNAYQMREDIPDCSEYAELMAGDKWPFPPVTVYKIGRGKGARLQLVSGFTRVAAAKAAKRKEVPATVIAGTKAEAMLCALAENSEHGYRRTNRDKRKAVICCKGSFPDYSANQIATVVGVTRQFVSAVFRELAGDQGVKAIESVPEKKPAVSAPALGKDCTANYGDCPVCGASKWEEHNDGVRCIACGHYHGETPAADEDEDLELESAPAPERKEKTLSERVKEGMAEVGRITRSLEELGLLDRGVAECITSLRKAVASVRD